MEELKRCPFCGGEIKLMCINYETDEHVVYCEDMGNCFTWLRCYGCDTDFYHDEPIYTPEKIIEWCNNRKPVDDVLERLEKELNFADAEKKRCAKENPLQFDSAKGYAQGLYNAIKIIKEELGGMTDV